MATLFDPPSAPRPRHRQIEGVPLADRMRPTSLDGVVGHAPVVARLSRALDRGRLQSMIFWGPPGTGKTTLARIVAEESGARFVPFSAVVSRIKEVRQVMADAARFRAADGRQTLVFIDEIHRFNRAQQDAFLPYVESGEILLVGATTENPSFEVNGPLLSRCRVVVLDPLREEDVEMLITRALEDPEKGVAAALAGADVEIEDEALRALVRLADGDARRALTLLEMVASDLDDGGEGSTPLLISKTTVERVAQRKVLLYDKGGEQHFNLISALHKSLRESDSDAALYWLTRMLEAGEDAGYIARRMVRFASEDIGLADPEALRRALDAWEAYDRLGSPEGDLALGAAALYLATAPKSDAAYRALGAARAAVRERPAEPVPEVLRNAPTKLMKELGFGDGYQSAHANPEGVAGIECLPAGLEGSVFYRPTSRGFESRLSQRLQTIRQARRKAAARKSEKVTSDSRGSRSNE